MSIIEHYKAARELTLQSGTLFEVGPQNVGGQELLGSVNAPGSMRDLAKTNTSSLATSVGRIRKLLWRLPPSLAGSRARGLNLAIA